MMGKAIENWRNKYNYKFVGTRCLSCNFLTHPPVKRCPKCFENDSETLLEERLPEKGIVVSFSIVYKSTETFQSYCPYAVSIIRLDKMNLNVAGQIVRSDIGKIEIGDRVKAVRRILFEDKKDGVIFYGVKWKLNEK